MASAFLLLRLRNRGPLKMDKSVSGRTAILRIKNRGKEPLINVLVVDKIVRGAPLECSITPNRENLDDKTEHVIWDILELGPGEEVAIQYVTSKIVDKKFKAIMGSEEYYS